MSESHHVDFVNYLYRMYSVRKQQGRVLVVTDPAERGGHVISPDLPNGFVGAVYRAYNEHRHLILSPDDVWLAVTTAFGLFMGVEENAEMMREKFVDFEGKVKLVVAGTGNIYSANWGRIMNSMSDLIEKNTKGDTRKWLEPDFSTTTPVCRTVGQVVLMGVMKHYFEYKVMFLCGIPKVTLEGSLEDWKKLQQKISHLGSFGVDCLSHWSGLLGYVLQKMVDSYEGKVDTDFWSRIVTRESYGSGGQSRISGWINVFMPFSDKGVYKLSKAKPQSFEWGTTPDNDIPPAAVEVPVEIDDNGREYKTIFYGGLIVCLYNPDEDSIRPAVDWAMVDITDSTEPPVEQRQRAAVPNYRPEAFPKPAKFSYGA